MYTVVILYMVPALNKLVKQIKLIKVMKCLVFTESAESNNRYG